MPRYKPRVATMRRFLSRQSLSVQRVCISLLAGLLLLLALVQLHGRLDARLCDTAAGREHPYLCGRSTRVCADSDEAARPGALVVVAAGGSRAASTWLFNALRILLRVRDPNTISGWHADLSHWYAQYAVRMAGARNGTREMGGGGSRVDAFRAAGTSLLVKLHLVMEWHEFLGGGEADTSMERYVDAVFTSHRDVREVVRSVRDMGWGVDVSLGKMEHPDFCRKRRVRAGPKFLKSGAYQAQSVWVGQARAAIKCREAVLESAGRKLKMDVKAERLQGLSKEGTVDVLREMGKHLDYEYSERELEGAAEELGRLRGPRCDAGFATELEVNPVTQLHKGHVRVAKSSAAAAAEVRGMQAISGDALCGRWLTRHGYANAIDSS